MPFDREFWTRCEGQTIDSVYPLDRCVRVTADGAIFNTRFHERPAIIRLTGDVAQRERWGQVAAAELSHPSLVEVLARGEDKLGGHPMAYLVMERPDDNLAEVLTERPLTIEETFETIRPVIEVLRVLESRGFAHADLSPAGVFAFGEQIRIGCDDLVPLDAATTAAQSRAIAMLIEKMLGGARPEDERLSGIIRNCRKSATPWTLAQIDACLRGEQPEPAPGGNNKRGIYLAATVAIVALAAYALRPSPKAPEPAKAPETPPPPVIVKEPEPAPPAVGVRTGKPSPIGKTAQARETAVTTQPGPTPKMQPVTTMDGITQVMPEIPGPARSTINGRVRINVRVQTDNAGRVTQATLLTPGASKYFTDRVLAAARAWKFPPGGEARSFTLGFALSRQQTTVSVARGI
jgi:outer membrane biosynthesis protein TonB